MVRTALATPKRVCFHLNPTITQCVRVNMAVTVTYDFGADRHYISKANWRETGLPILCRSTKLVGVANDTISQGQSVTKLAALLTGAAKADTFCDFPSSLMSVGKTANLDHTSLFKKDRATVHK